MPIAEVKEFEEKVISIDRVARVVKGGRRFRFRATVVVGDGKGRVGVGVGKGGEVMSSIAKATSKARKNLIQVPLRETTIPHTVEVRFSGARVLLKPAAEGTGVIAGGAVRAVLEAAGVHDVLTKSLGSSNKVNVVKATEKALKALVTQEGVARRRGLARPSEAAVQATAEAEPAAPGADQRAPGEPAGEPAGSA